MPTVNVVSERQTNRIDRQVYDIKNDASTAGASIGDVLNNVPSVNVDPNGTVRLRGSERVTVLVDGKPTAQMQGENRAAAINALPAENYESATYIDTQPAPPTSPLSTSPGKSPGKGKARAGSTSSQRKPPPPPPITCRLPIGQSFDLFRVRMKYKVRWGFEGLRQGVTMILSEKDGCKRAEVITCV